jgi:adenylate cyclase class 2
MELLEIEIKAYCDNEDDLLSRLRSMGARLVEQRWEEDVYFSHPARDFKQTDEALRIRNVGRRSVLTYKGPRISGRSKTRDEQETDAADGRALEAILFSLGFTEAGRVSKARHIYALRGIEICIDRVQGLGLFVELEKKDHRREEVEAELFALAEELGLARFEGRSYLELVLGGAPL